MSTSFRAFILLNLLGFLNFSCGRTPEPFTEREEAIGYGGYLDAEARAKAWDSLPIEIHLDSNIDHEWEADLYRAFTIWEDVAGKTLFQVSYREDAREPHGNPILTLMGDGINGVYFINNWLSTEKPMRVLATTSWSQYVGTEQRLEADILFNNQTYAWGSSMQLTSSNDPTRRQIDITTVAVHEIGHLLGLEHCEHPTSVMYPEIEIEPTTEKRIPNEEDALLLDEILSKN